MNNIITPTHWMFLSQEVRQFIIDDLKMTKSGGSEVYNGEQISDGITYDDLQKISVSLLRTKIESDGTEDVFSLFFDYVKEVEKTIEKNKKTPVVETKNTVLTKDTSNETSENFKEATRETPIYTNNTGESFITRDNTAPSVLAKKNANKKTK